MGGGENRRQKPGAKGCQNGMKRGRTRTGSKKRERIKPPVVGGERSEAPKSPGEKPKGPKTKSRGVSNTQGRKRSYRGETGADPAGVGRRNGRHRKRKKAMGEMSPPQLAAS